ncbi:DNA polymerase III, delta prime subunit [Desulfobulbus propionicus DSM 2032]|jgi:DNA polymerase-3 subunit delta'|uniref:DNA polymerase III, delta prime subunit n=1 Tax=Desulfobulbus propionicus (strain ATCC 33891 / DSM 2032 / VKM B-1956 / 1pr3) TaxID=577650 RepID=A0A7U3YJF4_DESPD|nr:DNA polymerase III subunit delta' [Desulfobulbus propionicus]ADW16498.1 DNA polymerase III, delta prime subunit [Desulfobulbus propionicus DSM 2032]
MAFSDILGQAKALALLDRALHSGRLAHAYLFAGPDGVGKTTVALELAAVLLCRAPREDRPCGVCPGCRKFQSGNHPDLVRIRPEGAAIKIDQIRELKKALSFPPLESRQRVVLLEEVHTMRREAGNSLLKVLEEPPADNILILMGNATGAILDTIVSRCQLIPFAPLPLPLAAEILRIHRPELHEADRSALAALADGCPGQALAFDADGILTVYQKVVTAWLAQGQTEGERVEHALALAVELAETKEGLEPLLALLRIFVKNAMAARAMEDVRPFAPEVLTARERWNLPQLSAKMTAIDLAEQALARNCNRGLTSEVLLLDLFDCGIPWT